MNSLVMAVEQAEVEPVAIRFKRLSQTPCVTPTTAAAPVDSCVVQFCRSGLGTKWDGANPEQSMLELAEANG